MTTEKIKTLIEETIADNKSFHVDNEKTCILNIEHAIGKYHAYMEVLEALDLEEFTKVAEETRERINELMLSVEKIYQ